MANMYENECQEKIEVIQVKTNFFRDKEIKKFKNI
jgi:hypothetical protein